MEIEMSLTAFVVIEHETPNISLDTFYIQHIICH